MLGLSIGTYYPPHPSPQGTPSMQRSFVIHGKAHTGVAASN